jgi:crotonobetainyl-CoA:carnitine CoA-transferase CaiB-like acyl-CoA transferase
MTETAQGTTPEQAAAAVRPRKRLPLTGIRIADLTAVWAGPYATRLLADMGAEVIKVESSESPDLLRSLHMQPPGTERDYNRSAYFNHNNRNKLGSSIDLARPGGKELFLQLVAVSDVVIENFRADVLDRLGLGYDVLRAVRPDIVLVSMPGHGKTGPEAGYIAYGTNVEQLAGLVSITGYEGGEPHKSGISYGDPIAGTAAAGAVMAALLYRRRTGRGQWVDLAQREGLTTLLGEYVVHYSMTKRVPGPEGNGHPSWAPHGVYRCAGPEGPLDEGQGSASQTSNDRWVAIAVRNDGEFTALCKAIGCPELASDARFADGLNRHRNREALDEPITAWTSKRTSIEAATLLQEKGVPAAPVESPAQLLDEDPQLRERGFFEEVTHRDAGTWRMERPVWRFSEAPAHIRTPGPGFAEHNQFVFESLMGLGEAELARLRANAVIGDAPNMAVHGR